MSRTARSRTRPVPVVSGTYESIIYDGSGAEVSRSTSSLVVTRASDLCADSIGRPLTPSSLNIQSNTGEMRAKGVVSAPYAGGSRVIEFRDYPVGMYTSQVTSALPAPSGWMLDLVAGTNPSRPVFTPPQILQDLLELPSLIKQTGELFHRPDRLLSPKELANKHLMVRFGWAPLFDDMQKLMHFQDLVAKRQKELEQLQAGGIRRRLRFYSNTTNVDTTQPPVLPTATAYAQFTRSDRTTDDQWATIRWYPSAHPNVWSSADTTSQQLAKRLILGLTVEGMASGVWNVIPWTWLIGWFTNVGKLTLATSNTVPATHGHGSFMSRRVVESKLKDPKYVGNCLIRQVTVHGTQTRSHKTRSIASTASPGVRMPFLGMSHAAIIASLFVQRMR